MRHTFFSSISKEVVFAGIFAVIALVSFALFLFPGNTEKKIEQKVAGTTTKRSSSPTAAPIEKQKAVSQAPSPTTTVEDQTTETKTIQVTIMVTPTPQPPGDKATISVTLDGVSPFSVMLEKGKNHCDVLTQALNDNKINQLLMKYDSSLDANGVYQINNLGKDNAIWWTYTVNGKSPNKGCNHIAANNGDAVNWSYVGSR